ncbi:hypothetical protein Halha_0125 [Halobacteroides halobius DSM 5150]|uniref:DUF501 domain-containing protein n=1 Tax=Halobacteroides halobius (strain ATCC 35273 / DSM 5150 / MD-1) TaxID=748449 RepID=L0K6I3_HALHC|nr:DUF501 domain-containing protein [Halobacteroides halobius]AGB40145.1 hypothetical protein Halha_0125 [Halobacteroides halobius DSM 5150]
MSYNEKDISVLKKQLGREPRNVVTVSKRCSHNYPQVVVTAPILDKGSNIGIFPTTFWLTCPELNYQISKLEEEGWIKKIQDKINANQQLATALGAAHQDYARYRLNLISEQKLDDLEKNYTGQYLVLKESGVGGILEFDGIKCLHTHYAHYLATDNNPVGRLVDKLLKNKFDSLKEKDCTTKCEEG